MKRKLLITSPYNIAEFESWLSDLALQGLYLKHLKHFFAYFICDEPSKMDYRVEIENSSYCVEQQEMYQLYGWKKVTAKGNITIYSCPSEQIKEEIHTIPIVQSYTLKNVKRKRTIMSGIMLLWIFATVLLSLYILFYNGTPILNLVNDGLQTVYCILADILLGIICIKEYRDISITYQTLKNGNSIRHHISWKQSKVFANILVAVAVPCLLLMAVNIYFSFLNIKYSIKDNSHTFSSEKYNTIFLKDIEKSSRDTNNEYNYRIRKNTNIFSKEIYHICEEQVSPYGNSFLETVYYNLNLKPMVKYTIADLIKSDMQNDNDKDSEIKKINLANVDNVYIISKGDAVYFYISKSNEIIRMKYTGSTNPNEILDLMTTFKL